MNLDAFKQDIDGIKTEENPAIVQQKSRDFYWYSPVLKERLASVTGDILVSPQSEEEVVRVLAAGFKHDVPITPRGTGTGNYGQAMPLSGGAVLNLADMNQIKEISTGRIICEPGVVCSDLDKAAREHSGQEMRIHPSTTHTATIGGFIAGGSGGIGSIGWGGLRDLGNVLRLRVVTMEAEPRVLEITGEDLQKVMHAYGTNGIITEVEMPLTAAYDWVDVIVGFDDFMDAARFGDALGNQTGILTKLITPVSAPAPYKYFKRHQRFFKPDQSICIVMVAPQSLEALTTFIDQQGGDVVFNGATEEDQKGLPSGFELSWNHTTLRALRIDPEITYNQVLYPFPNQLDLVEKMHKMFPDEIITHLEFVRFDGVVTCFGLPMIRYTTEQRLDEIQQAFEDNGCPIFNAHRYTLEEGGMKQTDETQLAFKREADPKGLLNPGKMIAFDDPHYDYSAGENWLFPGLKKAG